MVPYEKNEQFTGRVGLLRELRTMLCEYAPKQYNHRVALYGMGGVGKTQTAIAYVHEYKAQYDRIYWISAAVEASLLSGFQEIASRSGITSSNDTDAKGVAQKVLAWLRQQENWLLVIDNLDNIELIDNYLPERSPTKH